ncbi:ABC transporter permease [Solirhodobacter olei]|uniref:ABC transporter permease n=1 Tax=Solirhodobacter olei TaxID=2493082 RepID=UPI000FD7DCA4|nr:ABC transporter permease subunit [Solirhodobacter olei]
MTLASLHFSPGALLAPLVDWLNANAHPLFAAISAVCEAVLNAIEAVLLWPPALLLIALVAGATFLAMGLRLAILVALSLGFCLIMGLWKESIETIALVTVAVSLAVSIAFPLGVVASRRKSVEVVLRPILDIMQTVPPWVYLIPVVMIFSLGRVPALIATVVYGIPPMLRLTTLAFKQVPRDLLELGQAIGAPPRDILLKIELPAARPTLLVGLNQCILLSLAMVVLAGLVGSGGLGGEVTRGLSRMEMGLGLRAGLAIVAVAVLLDRLTRGTLQRKRRGAR